MTTKSAALPLVVPFLTFMIFLTGESFFPDLHYVLYPFKTLLVVAVLAWYWKSLPPMWPGSALLSVGIGILGIVLWVSLDPWSIRFNILLEELWNCVVLLGGLDSWKTQVDSVTLGGRNPFVLYPPAEAWTLFAIRLAGISLIVPIMEELFWRAFLMRWLMRDDFTAVPIGTYEHRSFWITTALFALVHGSEWPLAVVVGLLYGAWFVRTKRLGDVMVAHGTTNFLLALYCLYSNDWHFLSPIVAK
jgi:uncharacterized protein